MPTYTNTGSNSYYTKNGSVLLAGMTDFATLELLDDLPGVTRAADTPYTHEPRTIAADDTMTPWVWTPKGSHMLILGGDWSGTVTMQRATAADGSDAVLAGEFASDEANRVFTLNERVGAYYRYGFLSGGLASGSLDGNVEVEATE